MNERNKVIEAPQWLKDRMEKIEKLSRPSTEEVELHLRSSEKFRKQFYEITTNSPRSQKN